MVTTLHTCDDLVGWSFFNAVGKNDAADKQEGTASAVVDCTNVGDDFTYGFCNHPNADASTEDHLHLWVKADNVQGAVEVLFVLAPSAGNSFNFHTTFRNGLIAGSWVAFNLDLSNPDSTTGAPDITDIGEIRFGFYGSAPDEFKIDYMRLDTNGAPPAAAHAAPILRLRRGLFPAEERIRPLMILKAFAHAGILR